MSTELRRLGRFGIVGAGATATHMASALLCVELLAFSPELATTLGMTAAMAVSYYGHQTYTFGVRPHHRVYLPRFVVATAAAYVLNVGLVALNTRVLHLPYQVGLAVVALAIPLSNYLFNRLWVFERGLAADAGEAEPRQKTG